MRETKYDREAAVAYAKEWAYRRNPRYYDFSEIGGDCTNFVSQCLYAGGSAMNPVPTFGWYYYSSQNRAPAWTSVRYLYQFLTSNRGIGPYAEQVSAEKLLIGDLVQIRFLGAEDFGHTPIIVAIAGEPSLENILVAAHSIDTDDRPLSSYLGVAEYRFLHILGGRKYA
jgi:hypothetical protein